MKDGASFACSRIDQMVHDYLDNALLPEARKEVEHHLTMCPSCSRALWETEQVLGGLAALKEEPDPAAIEALVHEFRQVRHQDRQLPASSDRENGVEHPDLRKESGAEDLGLIAHEKPSLEEPSPDPQDRKKRRSRLVLGRSLDWPKLLAAGLAAVSLALATWVVQLTDRLEELSPRAAASSSRPLIEESAAPPSAPPQAEIAELEDQLAAARSQLVRTELQLLVRDEELTLLSQPQAFVPTTHIYPQTFLRNEDREIHTVLMPQGGAFFQLTFVGSDHREFSAHEVTILHSDGARVWHSRKAAADALGNFTLLFRSGFLPAGRYHAVLTGLEDGTSTELARYEWELVEG